MTLSRRTDIEHGHALAEAASAINRVADEMRGMDRRGSYVDPVAAAERALDQLSRSVDPVAAAERALDQLSRMPPLPDLEPLAEAIKELAHGLASLTRQVA